MEEIDTIRDMQELKTIIAGMTIERVISNIDFIGTGSQLTLILAHKNGSKYELDLNVIGSQISVAFDIIE